MPIPLSLARLSESRDLFCGEERGFPVPMWTGRVVSAGIAEIVVRFSLEGLG